MTVNNPTESVGRRFLKLNPRLSACASLVSGGVVIDIGTDHGYLPCFLVESGKCEHAYACDIAEGPLSSARATVAKEGLSGRVETVLSDGLLSLSDEAVNSAACVVIAGMGGELIAEIIGKAMKNRKLPLNADLILQPNTKAAFLRRFLSENGFEVTAEHAVRDGRFIYAVISARFTGNMSSLGEAEAIVGKLDPRDEVSREYIGKEIEKLRSAAKGMAESAADESRKKADELNQLADKIERYITK